MYRRFTRSLQSHDLCDCDLTMDYDTYDDNMIKMTIYYGVIDYNCDNVL